MGAGIYEIEIVTGDTVILFDGAVLEVQFEKAHSPPRRHVSLIIDYRMERDSKGRLTVSIGFGQGGTVFRIDDGQLAPKIEELFRAMDRARGKDQQPSPAV